MNQDADLITDDPSGSTEILNRSGGNSGRRTLPRITPHSRISTVQQQFEPQNFNSGPSISWSMSQPSSIFSPFPPLSPLSALHRGSPSSNSVRVSDTMPHHKKADISFGTDSVFAMDRNYLKALEPLVVGEQSQEESIRQSQSTSFSLNPPLSPGIFSPTNGTNMFTASEMNKIEGCSKLSELLVTSPKKCKRVLANRESAARSKKKRTQYILELEAQIRTGHTEYATLKTMYNQLQRDHTAKDTELREMRIRYEGMEKQMHLYQIMNDQSNSRLNEVSSELDRYRKEVDRLNMQQSLNTTMFEQLNINPMHQLDRNPDNFDEHIQGSY